MGTRARGWIAGAVAALLLASGAGVAVVVGDALGIRSAPSGAPAEIEPVAAQVGPAIAPPEFTEIDAPATLRLDTAIAALTDAAASTSTEGTAKLTVTFGAGGGDDDSYRLGGTPDALRVEAATETGAVRGVYDLTAAVLQGRGLADGLGATVASRLGFRMVDLGAVGVTPDPAEWLDGTDYSHASKAFRDVFLADAPFIDEGALARAQDEFEEYVQHQVALGYNALAFPGFVEFVTFEDAPGGPVYASGDVHVARAEALRDAFLPMWDYAEAMGMKVFLRTDMLALTTPLEERLRAETGLDTTDPRLWDFYAAGLDELYAAAPSLDGVLIRIGEAGRVYDLEGWDYYSALEVRTVDAVRAMLEALTAQAEASGREIIFRSWSVGVGAVGDMHTNPESYRSVLEGIDSPALIVSTKYTLGDFYSYLPDNVTLEQGDQRRIVEFQSRREFENFGAFPNDLAPGFQRALQGFLAANENLEGIWTWTQDGGPWRAGPMTLTLKSGFWQLYELNTMTAVALARDPSADVAELTADWARQWFSDDPRTVQAIVDAMALSRAAITDGLYIGPFAEQRVFAIGLEPPPMMWLFEWDILTGDSAVLDVISTLTADRIDEAIADGEAAVSTVERMQDLVEGTDAASWRDATLRDEFTATLDYERDVLELLSSYRGMILHQGQWHASLSPEAYSAWQSDRDRFEALADAHVERYDGDVDHPAFNLTAAELGVERADRDLAMAWMARVLLLLAAAWLLIGMFAARTRLVRRPGAAAARAAWLASTRPWRAFESTLGMFPLDRLLLVLVPGALLVATRAAQTSFLAPVHLLATLGAWVLFVAVVMLVLRGRDRWAVIAAAAGVMVLRCTLALIALSVSGPGGYWYAFWTDPVRRAVYITVAFALFVWVFVAAGWALASSIGARRATGTVLLAVGVSLAVAATAVGLVGLEQALTLWNDQLGLLPWGLARILGITVYLDIPPDTAWFAAAVGAVVAVAGALLALPRRRRAPAS